MKNAKKTGSPLAASALQYAFLIDSKGRIHTCDELGRDFLRRIDPDTFYAQIQSIKINYAITGTTTLIGNTSYNLNLVPVSLGEDFNNPEEPDDDDILKSIAYIAVLQDQAKLSEIYEILNQIPFTSEGFGQTSSKLMVNARLKELLEKQSCGIFIADSKSAVVYTNSMYEKVSGNTLSAIIGKKLKDLNRVGVINPIMAPTILETGNVYTTMQKYGTGKRGISSGAPIYNSHGKPILTITCTNSLGKIMPADLPSKFYETATPNAGAVKPVQSRSSLDIIANSPAMKSLVQDAIKVARHDVSILILGESGAGKEVIASIIHAASQRNNEKFVRINCSSITASLLESELFGYAPGSFTGALAKGKMGFFEVADGGTLLLDEIGDMPFELQAKILRVIQNKEVYRVGSVIPIQVDVRIIASTNKNLERLISEGKFRQDLYYRLNVISLDIPPLRSRREDVKPLLLHFNHLYNKKYYTNKVLSDELIQVMCDYPWPGNVRELQNVVERMTVLCLEHVLLPEHFYERNKSACLETLSGESVQFSRIVPLKEAVDLTEKTLVTKALEMTGSTRGAAGLLEVSQSTVMRKIKEHAIKFLPTTREPL